MRRRTTARPSRRAVACAGVLAALLIAQAGCGGGAQTIGKSEGAGATAGAAAEPQVDGADPDDVAVIESWAKALSDGDVEAAARLFAIPSTAENGPVLIRIRDAKRAEAFNSSLPCGAMLTRAVSEGQFTTATFRLTERPGGACGQGTDGLAQTSFVIEDGKIVEWRRVGEGQAPSQGQFS